MANEKVSQMVALTAAEVAGNDLFMIVDSSARESKKISVTDVITYFEATGSFIVDHATRADTASFINGSNVHGTVSSSSFANTSSFATNASSAVSANSAISASYAATSSVTLLITTTSASFATLSATASFARTSSLALQSRTSSFLIYAGFPNGTSSYALVSSNANSASFAQNSINAVSSSNTVSSSWANTSISSNTSQTSSFCTFRFGPTFITPVTVYSSNLAIGFTTFDASLYVTAGTKVVILDALASNANTNLPGQVLIRSDSGGSSYTLIGYRTAGGGDSCTFGGQGSFPIASDLTFQFSVTQASDAGLTIRLIGYY